MLKPSKSLLCLALIVGLVVFSVVQLVAFARIYFVDDPLHYERYLIAALIVGQRLRMHRDLECTGWHTKAWWIVGPTAVLLVVLPLLSASRAPWMYVFLLYAAGLDYLCWGRAAWRRSAVLMAAAAILIYPPAVVVAPIFETLHTLGFGASKLVTQVLYPELGFGDRTILIHGQSVAYTSSCAGVHFLMTFAALAVVYLVDMVSWPRLVGEVTWALILGFLLNCARVVSMIGMTRAGYGEIALVSGHALIGEAFIFMGCLILLARIDRMATSPSPSPPTHPAISMA